VITSRADLHCHSTSDTPPEALYALAKRRGMDFVTITDHDSIDGVLSIADREDVFLSVELTTWFRDAPQAVHVLCYGISAYDHDWLQRRCDDLEVCAAYLREHSIACALAHPLEAIGAPLTPSQRRRLAELFPVWETRPGGAETIGRTFTETPVADTPWEFLAHVRGGLAADRGSAQRRAA
jgi:predicted metal-dependent phosphoesterase TrpH